MDNGSCLACVSYMFRGLTVRMMSSSSWCFGVCSPLPWAVFIHPGCATLMGLVIAEEQMPSPLLTCSRSMPMCFHAPLPWDCPTQSRCKLNPWDPGALSLLLSLLGTGTRAGTKGVGWLVQECSSWAEEDWPQFVTPGCVCSGVALTPALAALLPWRLRVLLLSSWSIFASTLQCHEMLNFPHSCLPSLISQTWLLWLSSCFIRLHCCNFLVLTL